MISIYKSAEVKPHIIQLLKNEGLNITEDNIKIWAQDSMSASQVKLACDYIKSKGLAPVLVYTNKVPSKSYLQEYENVKIYDEEDLVLLSIRHDSVNGDVQFTILNQHYYDKDELKAIQDELSHINWDYGYEFFDLHDIQTGDTWYLIGDRNSDTFNQITSTQNQKNLNAMMNTLKNHI